MTREQQIQAYYEAQLLIRANTIDRLTNACHEKDAQNEMLTYKAKELTTALEFYADPFTWARVAADAQHMGALPGFDFNSMYGAKAREVLE